MKSAAAGDARFLACTALGLAAFPLVLHAIGGYSGLATQILLTGIAAIGFNLLLGYAGMLSYGQAMFYGGGGYVAGIVVTRFAGGHPNLWLAVLAAIVVTSLLAFCVGLLVTRLYGIYFALLTLAFAQMVFFVVEQAKDWTNGDDGMQDVPTVGLPFFGTTLNLGAGLPALDLGPFGNLADIKLWYVFAAIVTLLVLWFTRVLVRSQFGEVLGAIRENEERSAFVGFAPQAYRLAAFVIAGALGGLSGALRALFDATVPIDALGIDRSGSFVIYTIVGGVQTIFGPLAGTAAIMYLQNVISGKTDAWRLIEGLIFVLVIVFLPSGVVGTMVKERARRSRALLARSLRARTGGPAQRAGGPEPGAERR
ncbi:MAG TPA: branched-chain amino acid ABC transporter permease [Candidatus Acidoferrum sp.]|nr:branched-chain amino acid ABC transporter permease [Candidatus Acidoferrum sp.]